MVIFGLVIATFIYFAIFLQLYYLHFKFSVHFWQETEDLHYYLQPDFKLL